MVHALNAASADPAALGVSSHPGDVPPTHLAQPIQPAAAGSSIASGPASGIAGDITSLRDSNDAAIHHSKTDKQTQPGGSHAGLLQHSQGRGSHHLTANRVTLARISDVAQDQMEHRLRKARQQSIDKHVLQHDMFQGRKQPAHTVHRAGAIPESFQEPTLAAILRETALAGDLARREAGKAARAADTALPLFVTASASPESTSRQHSRSSGASVSKSRPNSQPVSRPASAASTLSRRQLASELSSGSEGLLPRRFTKLQSPRGKTGVARESFSPSTTGRLGGASSSLQVCSTSTVSAVALVGYDPLSGVEQRPCKPCRLRCDMSESLRLQL